MDNRLTTYWLCIDDTLILFQNLQYITNIAYYVDNKKLYIVNKWPIFKIIYFCGFILYYSIV